MVIEWPNMDGRRMAVNLLVVGLIVLFISVVGWSSSQWKPSFKMVVGLVVRFPPIFYGQPKAVS